MLVGRAGLSPVMIGRTAELERLIGLLEGASHAEVALVGAEAGVGKTRLVREVVRSVPAGTVVLGGQADQGSLGRPFSLLADVLGRPLPELGEATATTRADAVRTAADLVVEAFGGHRALVVFEDLHWADAESIEVFDRLATCERPVLLVGTYRTNELTRRHPATDLILRLERRMTVANVQLDRFSAGDVNQFLTAVFGEHAPYRAVEQLHARSGGNPFFLEELVGTCHVDSVKELCVDQPLPWSLAEVVRSQLDGLDPEQRRVVEAAAVLGRRVPFDLLATVARATEGELIAQLRALVERGLLAESEPDVFSFRHALVAETVSGELLGRERRRLHEAALAALQESGSDDFAGLAHHAQGAGRFDQMVEFARQGVRHYLSRGSSHQALQLAELGLSEADRDLDLLGAATLAAWLIGTPAEAVQHGTAWRAAAAGAGDPGAESAALRHLVRLRWDLGQMEEMWREVAALEAVAEAVGPCEEQARAYALIAQMHMLANRSGSAVEWADRSLAVAEEVGARVVRPQAMVEKGSAMLSIPALRMEGKALLVAAADAAEAVGDDVSAARALHNLSSWNDLTPPDAARPLLERMRRAAERAGFEAMATLSYSLRLADLAMWQGDRAEALARLEDARKSLLGDDATMNANDAALREIQLALEGGFLDRAAELHEQWRRGGVPDYDGERYRWGDGLEIVLRCAHGEPLSSARLQELLDRFFRPGLTFESPVFDVVMALLTAGYPPERLAAGVEEVDDGSETAVPIAAAMRALLALAAGDHGEAAQRLQAVVAGPLPLPVPLVAEVHLALARALLALGRHDDALVAAEEAAVRLDRWPGRTKDAVEALLRRLGRGDDVEGPAELTPREREVAALLAEGLSNAELAERLYISPKTAAVHVSNILAKLGMSSRAEIAAWAVRKGVAPSV